MNCHSSLVVPLAQEPLKVAPVKAGASPAPAKAGPWQPAQLAAKSARPAVTWACVKGPVPVCASA